MATRRFSLANLSLKHRLPLLIGSLLLGIIIASTLASYRGVRQSALEVGRERLKNLTQQLATTSHQSTVLMLTKTQTAANNSAIHAFLQSPSPVTRSEAAAILQQFTVTHDPNSLRVELWNSSATIVLIAPDGVSPEMDDLNTEFAQCARDPFRAVGALRLVKEILVYPALAATTDKDGKVLGYLVRWRRLSVTPDPRGLRDLLGSEATLYFGNIEGDFWTDLVKPVSSPPSGFGSTLEPTNYLRDGNSVMALGRPIRGTPFFVVVEFPDHVLLSGPNKFLGRLLIIDAVLLAFGLLGAFTLSRSITGPLDLLTGSASRISGGDYSGIVQIPRNDELGALGNAFNSMVAGVRSSRRSLEEKIQELKLMQETASKLAAIVESSQDAIIGKTGDGIITSWNKSAERLYGYSAEEVVGRSIAVLLSPDLADEIATILKRVGQGESIDHFETDRITKDGRQLSISLTISPIRDESGAIIGSSTIARDITKQKRSDKALRSSEIRYRRLFESAKDGILILDAESGRTLDANPYFLEMLGTSKEKLLGQELWEMGPFKNIVASKIAFDELQERGFKRYEDLPLEDSDGIIRNVEFVSNSYFSGERRVIQCNIRDITERKMAEEELRRTNQRLEGALADLLTRTQELASMTQQLWQASKLATMGELAASVAHELNNPLATISLHTELIVGLLANDDPNLQSLRVVEQEVGRMATLVGNLLQFSRRSQKQISTVDLGDEVTKSLDFIQYHLRSHRIDIVNDCATVLPSVQADREQLRQVFLNLITNASDAMPGGGTLTVRSRAGVMAGGHAAVVIEFSDTGIGVKTGDLPKLWEPFFTTKPEGKGTGLGLAICRRTVEDHRGTIVIETEPGKGTTVRITLPATAEDFEVAA
ncbi:MAG: PAS domain S-box protein [Pyrinomonadaceae bacterium]|nr:PAS domain S-box protein [Pyrinomonadaceae bacterium]